MFGNFDRPNDTSLQTPALTCLALLPGLPVLSVASGTEQLDFGTGHHVPWRSPGQICSMRKAQARAGLHLQPAGQFQFLPVRRASQLDAVCARSVLFGAPHVASKTVEDPRGSVILFD